MNNEKLNRNIEDYKKRMLNEYTNYRTQNLRVEKVEEQNITTKDAFNPLQNAKNINTKNSTNSSPKSTPLLDTDDYKYFDAKYMQYADMGELTDNDFLEKEPIKAVLGTNTDIKKEAPSLEEQYNDFKDKNKFSGTLRVQTFAQGGAFPIENVLITILKPLNGGDYIITKLRTDNSGQTDVISLPTVDKNLSLSPDNTKPYKTYKIIAEHPNYITVVSKNVPIFDSNLSLQVIDLIPQAIDPTLEFIEIVSPEPFGTQVSE